MSTTLKVLLLVFSTSTVEPRIKVRLDTWLTTLPDSQALNTVSFVGTWSSAKGYMDKQLADGNRVLDMHVRRTSDVFAMHQLDYYLGVMFGDMVRDAQTFLQNNPGELVVMVMKEDRDSLFWRDWAGKSPCEILKEKYLVEWPILQPHWSSTDTIGQHRGRILLGAGDDSFTKCLPYDYVRLEVWWTTQFETREY